jgi:hypothetical protein
LALPTGGSASSWSPGASGRSSCAFMIFFFALGG